jgi:hypothetical protein
MLLIRVEVVMNEILGFFATVSLCHPSFWKDLSPDIDHYINF